MPSKVLSPPSRYRHTARPGLIHGVSRPCGNIAASGAGERFDTRSLLTSALRSAPMMTARHGVVIAPLIFAGVARRSTSSAG